jgi:hypothetical protein
VGFVLMMMKMKKKKWMQVEKEGLQIKIALHLLRSVVHQVNAQAQRKYHELRKTVRSR